MGKFEDIFDDVVVNAKAAASVVSKKAVDVYDNSKNKIIATEMKSEINAKLKELGALTYKAIVESVDLGEEINAKISEITELRETLNLINENATYSQNVKKCEKCGTVLPKNSVFCNICGEKISNC